MLLWFLLLVQATLVIFQTFLMIVTFPDPTVLLWWVFTSATAVVSWAMAWEWLEW